MILPDPIPGKGRVLTRIFSFWFKQLQYIMPNHLTGIPLEQVVPDAAECAQIEGRAIVVKILKPLPVEAIVRGYLIGSGWKEYQKSRDVCGIKLPAGLKQAQQLPEAIYTPSTKAAVDQHDENVSFEQTVKLMGQDLAEQVRDASWKLYKERKLC